MKKLLLFLLFFLFTVCPAFSKTIECAVISDTHLRPSKSADTFTQSEKNLIFAIDSVNRNKNIDFVVFLGDNIDKSNMDSLVSFMNIVKNLKVPYYLVFGNHDSYAAGGVSKEDYSEYVHSINRRQHKEDTSFYFRAGSGAYGLILDGSSYVVPGKHGRYVPELVSEVDKFLKFKKHSMVFLFQHFPLISPTDNVSHDTLDLENFNNMLLKHNNVVFIASGHFHHEKITLDERGVYHISASALGARSASSGSGKYQVIKIDYDKGFLSSPKNIKVDVIDVKI